LFGELSVILREKIGELTHPELPLRLTLDKAQINPEPHKEGVVVLANLQHVLITAMRQALHVVEILEKNFFGHGNSSLGYRLYKVNLYCTMQDMNSQEASWLLKEKYNGEKSEAFFADVARLEAGEPLAYLIDSIPFLGTTITLTSKPLIPRPETEFWVEKAITTIKETQRVTERTMQVLDLCAGSGCIGVAVGNAIPESIVHFVELVTTHLPTITHNCEANNLPEARRKIIESDLFTGLRTEPQPRYDFILSNPPYIDPKVDRAEASVKAYEPALALYGGWAGIELIARIITEAPNFLLPHGQLWLEHEPEQAELITELAKDLFTVSIHTDQYGVNRFSKLVLQ
jgi:release factor glutamine methyltransferase